ncbi:MAG TPA: hypothetical protein VLR70_02330 [Arthrobacter sp.]|nr:hypothetical protein [Arthrobacter sp.]
MDKFLPNPSRQGTVALVRWSKKPGENPVVGFVMFSVFALILCLILMIFISGLRSFGAVVLFTVTVAAMLTGPAVSRQRAFMTGLTQRVNATIAEVTGTVGDQLSVKEFRRMIRSGEPLSLLVGGVPGLNLHVERVAPGEANAPEKWFAVFTVVPPEIGTASFDRLLAAASGAHPGTASTDGS